jgi:LL-diaminopimelate aminotransferase
MPQSAERLGNLPPYIFAVLGQRIQAMISQGIDVISLDIGSPDLPPPQPVIDTLAASAQNVNNHGYSGYRGSPAFRQAVAQYYGRRFNVDLDSESEVLPLIGSKEGIINLCFAYLDRGDAALVPNISYPSYSIGAQLAGADVCWISVNADDSYLIDISSLSDVADKAKLLWVNYPNNPTGATATMDFYKDLIDFCKRCDILLVSDNPYVDVTYDGYIAPSILEIPGAKDCSVEFMSCSKTYNMGGWRLGAAVGNATALKKLLQVKSNVDSGHFRPIYDAGTVALNETTQDWIDQRNHVYQLRRDLILDTLPHIGLEAQKPKGSLYIWAKVLQGNGASYVEQALQEASVALAPGAAYGPGGEHYIRISLGVPDNRLQIALDRLQQWYTTR